MRYLVDVKDISYATVEVNADSLEEAQSAAEEIYYNGRIDWDCCDLTFEAREMEKDRGDAR